MTPEDILTAIVALGGDGQPVAARAIHGYVTKDRHIDEESFQQALGTLAEGLDYQYQLGGAVTSEVPDSLEGLLQGALVKQVGTGPKPTSGRTIVIQGALRSINDVAPFFQRILKPLDSQRPTTLTIEVKVDAHFEKDPGGGLDAALDDGFDNDAFPGLTRTDSRVT